MRHHIAIGGIHIESSTFSPHRSGPADFTLVRGDELLARHDDVPGHVDRLPLVHARALPGGAVERDFYEVVKTELLERLRATVPLDGVLLDIHGAMSVVGMTDAEGDLASAVRDVVGPAALISAAMDPHGNMSRRLVTALDLATSHRLSPHEDAPLTRKRAAATLREARGLAERYWDARSDFAFSTAAGDADWCIATALASRERPFFISDSGDNPTAGGAGDVAYMLERLLSHPALASGRATAIWASVVDPSAVARCMAVGEGGAVELHVGGVFGSRDGAGVALRGTVTRVSVADPLGGDSAVVASGGVRAVLTSRRKPFHFIRDFTRLGLDPRACDLTVVKVGYLVPDLFDAAKGSLLALTPGGVDQDILRLGHTRLDRPIYPLDSGMPTPDLTPVIVH